MKEPVLLLDAPTHTFRVVVLTQPNVSLIAERVHVSPTATATRIWRWLNQERALTGQRIFREELATSPVLPSEAPRFDEDGHQKPIKIPLTPFDS